MDWITTANGLIALLSGLIGLVLAGISAYFGIKAVIKNMKNKTFEENWALIMSIADAAMRQAEDSYEKGEDKKEMVINMVRAACENANINMDDFLNKLSSYIDQSIAFVNSFVKE